MSYSTVCRWSKIPVHLFQWKRNATLYLIWKHADQEKISLVIDLNVHESKCEYYIKDLYLLNILEVSHIICQNLELL